MIIWELGEFLGEARDAIGRRPAVSPPLKKLKVSRAVPCGGPCRIASIASCLSMAGSTNPKMWISV